MTILAHEEGLMDVTETVTVRDLLNLWHGEPAPENDDPYSHVCGYWHPEIVVKFCELGGPSNDRVVRNRFYPGKSDSEVPEYARKLIRLGYDTWKRRRHA